MASGAPPTRIERRSRASRVSLPPGRGSRRPRIGSRTGARTAQKSPKADSTRSMPRKRPLRSVPLAQHDLGDARASQRALDEVVARYAESGPYRIAVIYAWRGETDRAF